MTTSITPRPAAGSWRPRPGRSRQPRLQRHPVEARDRKRGESGDAVLQVAERGDEGGQPLNVGALGGRRVLDAPVRRHRLPGPDRADLAGGVVADGEHEIERAARRRGRTRPRASSAGLRSDSRVLEHLQRQRVDGALRVASGGERPEAAHAVPVEDAFGDHRARRVAGAEEEDVEDAVSHEAASVVAGVQQGVRSAISGAQMSGRPRQQSLTRKLASAATASGSAR